MSRLTADPQKRFSVCGKNPRQKKRKGEEMKKLILTAVCILASLALLSCGERADAPAAVTNAPEIPEQTTSAETADYLDTLEKRDLEGRTITVCAENMSVRIANFHSGAQNGEVLNDALYLRDSQVAERYNAVIEYFPLDNRNKVVTAVTQSVLAGDGTFGYAIGSMTAGASEMLKAGVLYRLSDIPHIRTGADYWYPSANECLKIGNDLYFAASPIAAGFFATPFGMSFNKRLTESYGFPDLYGEVRNGSWTVSRMSELTKGLSQDLNQDGVMDSKDFYGFGTHTSAVWGYYAGDGSVPLTIHGDGSFDSTLDSRQSVDKIEKLAGIFADPAVYYYDGSNTSHIDLFLNGQAVLVDYSMTGFIVQYRDMQDDWGIIPLPKYTEEQEKYYTVLQTQLPCALSVPADIQDPDAVGLILETMAYLSDLDIREAVYDVILTGKLTRDEDSVEMLDLIYSDIRLDLLYVYRFGNMVDSVVSSIVKGKGFSSVYESTKNKMEDDIAALIGTVSGASS